MENIVVLQGFKALTSDNFYIVACSRKSLLQRNRSSACKFDLDSTVVLVSPLFDGGRVDVGVRRGGEH